MGEAQQPPTVRRAAVTGLSTGATQSKIATKILLRFSDRERIIWGLIWLPADSIDVAASSCASIFAVFLCFAESVFMSHPTLKRGCERCLSWEERINLLKLRIDLDVSASMDKAHLSGSHSEVSRSSQFPDLTRLFENILYSKQNKIKLTAAFCWWSGPRCEGLVI